MDKKYISANELALDSFRLAEKIYLSGFRPDFIVGIWRGGTPVGIAIHEYLEYLGIPSDHIAIRTSLYQGIDQQKPKVSVYGLDYLTDKVRSENNLLLVDDVFDTGKSMSAALSEIQRAAKQNAPHNLKIATPWYKPKRNVTQVEPDFYLHKTDRWLVFPHELMGLSEAEIKKNKPEIADTVFRHIAPRLKNGK